ncbi:MAG: carbohydrate kinase family protein [Candidatus Gracilibacteria bacterium]|nr:carbohydrate kinase family protein [Candidatus Gracilibacteria bacterium]
MKVLGIGEIVVDKTYILDEFMTEDQKSQSVHSFQSVGGPTPSALALLSNLGCECIFIGKVGNDENSLFIKNELEKYNIKADLIYDKKTKVNTVVVNELNSSRSIIRDTSENSPIKDIKHHLIKDADIIIFDRHEFEAFQFVMKHKKQGTQVILDLSSEYSPKVIDMMKQVNYPIFSIEAVLKSTKQKSKPKINNDFQFEFSEFGESSETEIGMFGSIFHNDSYFEEPFEEVYKAIGKPFITTAGKDGVYLYDGKNLVLKDVLKVNAIDNNGAGDVFRGAFAYGVLQNWSVEKIVDFAIVVSALQCEKVGNLTAIPKREEIEKYFKF